jgi:putative membrane protein
MMGPRAKSQGTIGLPPHLLADVLNDKSYPSAYSVILERGSMRLLLNWVLSALAVWIVAQVVPGVHVSGATAALIAALAIGFINATLGALLKIITFPLTLVTLGLFWFVINALMLELASAVVPGFNVRGFGAAFIGAIVLSLVNLLLKAIVMPQKDQR